MAITLTERLDSRESTTGPNAEVTFHYILSGIVDDLTAKATLLSSTPTTYDGLVRDSANIKVIYLDTVQDEARWNCEVRYVKQTFEVGDSQFAFEISGAAQQHITHSKETMGRYAPAGQVAADHKGAIGVTPDGNIEGIDVQVPVHQWSETHYFAADYVDTAYKAALGALVQAPVNAASFRGYPAGEVLFLGGTGTWRAAENDWALQFRFAQQPNITNGSVGNGAITGINKKGWEYLWVQFGVEEDANAHRPATRPIAAYVERVYDPGDFGVLGIGS